MAFARGMPQGKLEKLGQVPNRRGTTVRFQPDPQIFGEGARSSRRACSRWRAPRPICSAASRSAGRCDKALLAGVDDVPEQATFHFQRRAEGLSSPPTLHGTTLVHPDIFAGKVGKTGGHGAVEWAVAWIADADGFVSSYCNTIPTPDGGTHEAGLRTALLRGLRDHAERVGQASARRTITSDDVMIGAGACSRCSSASRNSRARPRTGSPPSKRSASSRHAIKRPVRPLARRQSRSRRTSCSTG